MVIDSGSNSIVTNQSFVVQQNLQTDLTCQEKCGQASAQNDSAHHFLPASDTASAKTVCWCHP